MRLAFYLFGICICLTPMMCISQNYYGFDYDIEDIDLHFSIPEVALLDIEPVGISNIELSISPSAEPGSPITINEGSNSSLWVNYTSSLATGSNNRSINIHIADGNLPPGLQLTVTAATDKGKGKGSMGSSTGEVVLSTFPRTIITGIGRCYTGNGKNRGHQLIFSLSILDYEGLEFDEELTLQITYTITDN